MEELKEFIFTDDPRRMNWLREDYPYAEVICPKEFTWTVQNVREGDILTTKMKITNNSRHSYFTNIGTIGIRFPMQDRYDATDVCLNYRCHTHIFCGKNTSYAMCLRMGGDAPHLGMVLTKGSLSGYSMERDIAKMSNDRGCFILHPSPKEFAPGETMELVWKLFPHSGKEDFYRKLQQFPSVVLVESERYVLFEGEKTELKVKPSFAAETVKINGQVVPKNEDGTWHYEFLAENPGEYTISVESDEVKTFCVLFVQVPFAELLEKRCRFIADHQQYAGTIRELSGAYLAYDNEENHLVYMSENDYNAGRERTGMGVLMARFLRQNGIDGYENLQESLKKYREYYLRELVEKDTGLVCNDTDKDNSYFRLYNYPWAATFFVECYRLWKQMEDLETAKKIIYKFYEQGGERFYPIELPVVSLYEEVKKAGQKEDAITLRKLFCRQADWLAENGRHYPAHEVNYEQSIIAPAADVILQVYEITGEEIYLKAAREQVAVLELFNGRQQDYHLHEVAIRHWDGYWFGKRRMYGDTFPHYWSAETGRIFRRYACLTGDTVYQKKAENSLRGVLPMFFGDGRATCAYVFPYSVNGIRADFADPYANDQDWGLCSFLGELTEN